MTAYKLLQVNIFYSFMWEDMTVNLEVSIPLERIYRKCFLSTTCDNRMRVQLGR